MTIIDRVAQLTLICYTEKTQPCYLYQQKVSIKSIKLRFLLIINLVFTFILVFMRI